MLSKILVTPTLTVDAENVPPKLGGRVPTMLPQKITNAKIEPEITIVKIEPQKITIVKIEPRKIANVKIEPRKITNVKLEPRKITNVKIEP